MPRPCPVCHHADREQIDRALVLRRPARAIVDEFAVARTTLQRHEKAHLPALLREAVARERRRTADELVETAEAMLDRAQKYEALLALEGDLRGALGAIRQQADLVRLLLDAAPTSGDIEMPATKKVFIATGNEQEYIATLRAARAAVTASNGTEQHE